MERGCYYLAMKTFTLIQLNDDGLAGAIKYFKNKYGVEPEQVLLAKDRHYIGKGTVGLVFPEDMEFAEIQKLYKGLHEN